MSNDMRNRLIDLIRQSHCVEVWDYYNDELKQPDPIKKLADHLIANGVIIPPVKVGDTAYVVEDWGRKKILKEKEIGVIAIKGTNDFSVVMWEDMYGGEIGKLSDIGETVFLTREEAEQKLKEMIGNNAE